MKLISVEQARALWLFNLSDLNPRGKATESSALAEIGKRYSFTVYPTPIDLVEAREKSLPLKFGLGTFKPKNGDAVIVDMLIYRDGIMADTRSSTADSTEFIRDLLTWSTTQFGFVDHETVVKTKSVISILHVSSDCSLPLINPKMAKFAELLTERVPGHPGATFEVGSIGFWADQALSNQPIPFRFERAAGEKFSENRYHSSAPLDTDVHLRTLQELEKILTK